MAALTLLGQSSSPSGGPPSATPRHLAESSTSDLSAPVGPLTGNPVLDREKISAPLAVDVSVISEPSSLSVEYCQSFLIACKCVVDPCNVWCIMTELSAYPLSKLL